MSLPLFEKKVQNSVNIANNLNEKKYVVTSNKNDKKSSNKVPNILYSVRDVEKQIKYFNSCAYYEYAQELSKYLELLILYISKESHYLPTYPSLCEYQPVNYKKIIYLQRIRQTMNILSICFQ